MLGGSTPGEDTMGGCFALVDFLKLFRRQAWVGTVECDEDGFAIVDGLGCVDFGGVVVRGCCAFERHVATLRFVTT